MPSQRRRKLHIPLTSYGKRLRRRAWLTIWDRVKIPRYSHKLMHQKRVTCERHDSYFRSMMIKTCYSKDGWSCIFRWPVMGRDSVYVELLYNSVHRKFNQSEIRCWIEEHVPERLGPQALGWAARENGKETRLWPIEWRSICCSSVRSPTPSHTQPYQ